PLRTKARSPVGSVNSKSTKPTAIPRSISAATIRLALAGAGYPGAPGAEVRDVPARPFACPEFGPGSAIASEGAADTAETEDEPAAAGAGRRVATPQAEQNLASEPNSRPHRVQKGIAATSRLPHAFPTGREAANLSGRRWR